MMEVIVQSAREHPESGYLTGQAVFALVKFGRHLEAMEIAESCEAPGWWCGALKGHVFQSVGRVRDAEDQFQSFIATAPDSIACWHQDATQLLGSWSQRVLMTPPEEWEKEWSGRPCGQLMATSDTIWWLADPLYIVEGNDRWTEHVDRNLKARWYQEVDDARPSSRGTSQYRAARRAWITRRGPVDSWEMPLRSPRNFQYYSWTSEKAARYHFVPDFAGAGFSKPTWRLVGDFDDEGYTPPYGAFHLLPIQIARFRETGSDSAASVPTPMRYAVAGTVAGTPIAEAASSAYLILTDAPESFPLQLEAPFSEGRAVFLASAPPKRYVASLEVLTEAGIGWHREMVEPLNTEGPGISDLLFFQPKGFTLPDSLMAAASMMLAGTDLNREDEGELGVYWEVYGVPDEATITFEMELRREGGGLVERIRRLLPMGPEEGSGRLSWSEPGQGLVFPKSTLLTFGDLDPGVYTLILQASWAGQEVIESTRVLRVGDTGES
jgi:hypothetical protein